MFVITMANTFKEGDTCDVRINMAPAKVTWKGDTLVIDETDARQISQHYDCGDGMRRFVCSD